MTIANPNTGLQSCPAAKLYEQNNLSLAPKLLWWPKPNLNRCVNTHTLFSAEALICLIMAGSSRPQVLCYITCVVCFLNPPNSQKSQTS